MDSILTLGTYFPVLYLDETGEYDKMRWIYNMDALVYLGFDCVIECEKDQDWEQGSIRHLKREIARKAFYK